MQIDRTPIGNGNDHIAQIVEVGRPADVADQVLTRVLVGEPPTGVDAELGQRLFNLLIGDTERTDRKWVGGDPILADLATDRDHLRDARDGQ